MSLRIRNIDNYNTNPNICKKCGKPILANYDDRLSNIKRKTFCSSSCAASYNNKIREIDHDGIQYNSSCKLDDFSDEYIINAFSESSSIVEFARKLGYKRGVYLNSKRAKSRLEMLNINLLDIKHGSCSISSCTKKELFDKYPNYLSARNSICSDARNVYYNSSRPKRCICCGYDKHFEVAHIKAVSDFDDDALISEINNEDNLIALCPNHHWEYDNTDFDITPYLNEAI